MRYAYAKLDLNSVPPKGCDLDILNAAGQEGWRLVGIMHGIAYMIREIEEAEPAPAPKRQRTTREAKP